MQPNSTNFSEPEKWCKRCQRFRAPTDFMASYSQIYGDDCRTSICKTCSKLTKYRLTFQQYEKMRWDQNGLCAICGLPQRKGKTDDLVVDHDHKTGKVRALLCAPCNLAIGHFEDDPVRMAHAVEYLKNHSYS